MSEYGLYSTERAQEISEFVTDNSGREDAGFAEDLPIQSVWYYVKLTEDLDVATNELTGYTQAQAQVVKYSHTADNLDREVVTGTDDEITVTNRSTAVSIDSGEYIWVRRILAEFVPIIGSPASSGEHIGFVVTEADCDNGLVTTTLENIDRYTGCDVPPGADPYTGEYQIEDYFGLLTGLEDSEATNVKALAIWWNDAPDCEGHYDLLMIDWEGGC